MATKSHLNDVLAAEVGYHESFSNGHWTNHQKYSDAIPELTWSQDQAWCATFATWAYRTAGVKEGSFPVTASVWNAMHFYKDNNRWSEYPSVGAQVILGQNVHTGIVTAFDNDWIYTIEGNTNDNGSAEGDGVYRRTRFRRDDFVTGYGSPDFDPEPEIKDVPFPGANFFFNGQRSAIITAMGERLVEVGCSAYREGPGPEWTQADRDSYSKWQQKLGYTGRDADGIPGPTSWAKLKVTIQD